VAQARLAEFIGYEVELQSITRDIFNRGYLFQQLPYSIFLKPLE
jgi:hypothetical protein